MNKKSRDFGLGLKIVFTALAIIFTIVLIGNVIRISLNADTFTFTAFLEYISNAPAVDISFVELWNLGGNWGVFEFLRNFFNMFGSVLSFLVWLGKNIISVLQYVFYFVRFIFV